MTLEPLVADDPAIIADNHDAHLVNPWGIAFDAGGPLGVTGPAGAGGPFWVADNGAAFATLYDGAGVPQPLAVTTPSLPTGVVFNNTTDFSIGGLHTSFLFADQEGQISGWTFAADAHFGTAVVAAHGPLFSNYTGLAMATDAFGNNFLYAANFSSPRGEIDRYTASFVHDRSFTDTTIPIPFLPYNVQNIGGNLYVTYAQPDGSGLDAAPGGGYVDEFAPDGTLIRRVISNDHLSAPWGIVQAPADFGAFSNDLLVANHGDGTISAYDIGTGNFLGSLVDASGNVVTIDGTERPLVRERRPGRPAQHPVLHGRPERGRRRARGQPLAVELLGGRRRAARRRRPIRRSRRAEGQPFTAVLSTFTDDDPEATLGPPSDYYVVVNWGDGTTSDLARPGCDGRLRRRPEVRRRSDVTGTHTYAEEGSYEYTVTVYDIGGSVTVASHDIDVPDAGLDLTCQLPRSRRLDHRG